MADTAISALTEETTPADNDVVVIVDTSGSDNNKVQIGTLKSWTVNTVTASDASYTPVHREVIVLNHASVDVDITFSAALATGQEIVVHAVDNGATNHSVVLAGSQTWDGTNQTAIFNAADDRIHVVAISSTRVVILYNNSVTFSA